MSDPFTTAHRIAQHRYLSVVDDLHRLASDIILTQELCAAAHATDQECLGQLRIRRLQAELAELLA